MSTKKTEKAADKKKGGQSHEEPQGGRIHTIAKPRPTPVTGAPKEKPTAVIVGDEATPETAKAPAKPTKRATTSAAPTQPDDSQDTVVFAFRLLRSERLELHEATGSAKASKFVKAIVLAGARGDMKAIQEIVDGVQASRK